MIFLPGLCRFYGRNGFFLNFFQDGFFRKPLCQQVHFVPKSGVGRGMGVFIYALSADETSLALAAPRHAITALFSCRFKCPCPPRRQRHFHGNADRAYNTLHFASKVVCQRGTLWKPQTTKQAEYLALPRCLIFSLYLLSAARFTVCV